MEQCLAACLPPPEPPYYQLSPLKEREAELDRREQNLSRWQADLQRRAAALSQREEELRRAEFKLKKAAGAQAAADEEKRRRDEWRQRKEREVGATSARSIGEGCGSVGTPNADDAVIVGGRDLPRGHEWPGATTNKQLDEAARRDAWRRERAEEERRSQWRCKVEAEAAAAGKKTDSTLALLGPKQSPRRPSASSAAAHGGAHAEGQAEGQAEAEVALLEGTACLYLDAGGTARAATITRVHMDEPPPYYTIELADGGGGRTEKQTVRTRLVPTEPSLQRPAELLEAMLRASDPIALYATLDVSPEGGSRGGGGGALTKSELAAFLTERTGHAVDLAVASRLRESIDADGDSVLSRAALIAAATGLVFDARSLTKR
jgi:sRNA-binding protein